MTKKYSLLSVNVHAINIIELNREVEAIITADGKEIISNHNLHSVYLINKSDNLSEFWEKSYITHIDGMPLLWWGKFLGYPFKDEYRITYLDWIYPLLDLANKNSWKIYYLGGAPGIANKAVKKLVDRYSNIVFKTHTGYFNVESDSIENKELLAKIQHFKPNILMVGMGMPRQEKWIIQNYSDINANVILNSGACFDYIAGVQKAPPRFLGKIGLEWLYRLINDPKRLSKRYLVEPISLLPLFIRDIIKKYYSKK